MPQPNTHVQPLGRTAPIEVLDWQEVDRLDLDIAKDVLGLSIQDRQALGLSAPRTLEATTLGGAEIALADVLARSGAIGKTDFRRKR
jgi:hypothetical protein